MDNDNIGLENYFGVKDSSPSVPLDEVRKLRDHLYATDNITMIGVRTFNQKLIEWEGNRNA